jgi:methylated-DNA-protein-cysteine methyltransferase related protein
LSGGFLREKVLKRKSRGSGASKTDPKAGVMRLRIEQAIRSIPRGKVSTYGGIARAAGFPGAARQVAATLRRSFGLPWQRVLGAGGEIKLTGDSAIEQRLRLEAEGVRFCGRRVDMKAHEFKGPQPERARERLPKDSSKKRS